MSGIWDSQYLLEFNYIPKLNLSLGEGNTPLYNLKVFGQKVWVKDENLNPTGSFKDRCLAYQISSHYSLGEKGFVISSSGNAAISAASFIEKLSDATIDIFISHNINPQKLDKLFKLKSKRIRLIQDFWAKSSAIVFAKKENKINLRASNDPYALPGYKTIAYELEAEARNSDGIFIPASSATAALGIALGFQDIGIKIPIYVCQTTKINAIAKEYDKDFHPTKTSLADAIVDRVASRKIEVMKMIKDTKGDSFAISDELLLLAKEAVLSAGKNYSFNSVLGFAGLMKAKQEHKKINDPIILASGL